MSEKNNDIDQLIVRELDGEVTAEEFAQLEKWKEQSEENLKVYNDYKAVWHKSAELRTVANLSIDDEFQVFTDKSKSSTKISFLILKIAALVLLTVGAVFTVWNFSGSANGREMVVIHSRSAIDSCFLPDGSVVYLNKDSKLVYPAVFDEKVRKVELSGEAFFAVKKNAQKPFVIKTGQAEIKVLGTTFNVLTADTSTTVTVKTGEVELVSQEDSEIRKHVLAGYAGVLLKDGKIHVSPLDVANCNSWYTRQLTFENTSWDTVRNALEDFYKVEVQDETGILDNKVKVTGSFNDEPLKDVFKELEVVLGVKFKIEDNNVVSVQ